MSFDTEEAFIDYLNRIETAQYQNVRGRLLLENGDYVQTFICRRSNETKHHIEKRNERLIRTRDSAKLEKNCLSRFRILFHPDGTLSADYYCQHSGHDPDTTLKPIILVCFGWVSLY